MYYFFYYYFFLLLQYYKDNRTFLTFVLAVLCKSICTLLPSVDNCVSVHFSVCPHGGDILPFYTQKAERQKKKKKSTHPKCAPRLNIAHLTRLEDYYSRTHQTCFNYVNYFDLTVPYFNQTLCVAVG